MGAFDERLHEALGRVESDDAQGIGHEVREGVDVVEIEPSIAGALEILDAADVELNFPGDPLHLMDDLRRRRVRLSVRCDEVVEAIKTPDAREKLAAQLMEPIGNSPAEFRVVIEREIARWAPVIKAIDLKIN